MSEIIGHTALDIKSEYEFCIVIQTHADARTCINIEMAIEQGLTENGEIVVTRKTPSRIIRDAVDPGIHFQEVLSVQSLLITHKQAGPHPHTERFGLCGQADTGKQYRYG